MQQIVERSSRHVLADGDEVLRRVTGADQRQDIRMREDSQLRELLVEVAGDARRDLAHRQDLGDDVVVLPAAAPCLAGRADGDLRVQLQVLDVDALVAGQSRVAGARLQTQPVLVLQADLLQLLSALDGQVVQALSQQSLCLVQRRVAILVGERNECAVTDELLGDVLVAPEASVVQRRVAVLVLRVDVRLGFDQQQYDVDVAVGGGEVERDVFAHVCGVNASPAR